MDIRVLANTPFDSRPGYLHELRFNYFSDASNASSQHGVQACGDLEHLYFADDIIVVCCIKNLRFTLLVPASGHLENP